MGLNRQEVLGLLNPKGQQLNYLLSIVLQNHDGIDETKKISLSLNPFRISRVRTFNQLQNILSIFFGKLIVSTINHFALLLSWIKSLSVKVGFTYVPKDLDDVGHNCEPDSVPYFIERNKNFHTSVN